MARKRPTQRVIKQAPSRSCGACHACCVVLPIRAAGWEKGEGERCRHLDADNRCGVYGERPSPCRAFQCLWLAGRLPFETQWRPDRLGLVLTGMEIEGSHLLYAYEVWKGAATSHQPAVSLLSALTSDQVVVVVDPHPPDASKRAVGPEHLCRSLLP